MDTTGIDASDRLHNESNVHSLKMRIKEPEHSIEKSIRKRIDKPGKVIDVSNYKKKNYVENSSRHQRQLNVTPEKKFGGFREDVRTINGMTSA